MSLIELIREHALSAAQAGNWPAVADTLNALTTEVRVTELRTARWLMLQLTEPAGTVNGVPLTEADVVLGTLQAATIPRVKAAYDSLCNGGLDLSEDQVQEMLPLLAQAGNWPAGLAAKVMQAGRRNVAVLETPVTSTDCQKAWEAAVSTQQLAAIRARITNASALANERITASDTPEQQAAKWATAWAEAV